MSPPRPVGYLAFQADARSRISHLFTGGGIARVYEKVPWYATSVVQLSVGGFCVAAFIWTLVAWPLAALFRRFRPRASRSGAERGAEGVAIVLSVLNLLFLLVSIAAVGFIAWLAQWNLLGYRF